MSLKIFCADPNIECRAYLHEPFNIKGRICCTNGHVFVMGGIQTGLPAAHKGVKDSPIVRQLLEGMPKTDSITLSEIDFEKYKCEKCEGKGVIDNCYECHGSGVVELETDYSDYTIECKSCDGLGRQPKCNQCMGKKLNPNIDDKRESKTPFVMGEVYLDPGYIKLILDNLGETTFFYAGKHDTVYFKAGDIVGAVMGLRQ